jgi:hypothetical protein
LKEYLFAEVSGIGSLLYKIPDLFRRIYAGRKYSKYTFFVTIPFQLCPSLAFPLFTGCARIDL